MARNLLAESSEEVELEVQKGKKGAQCSKRSSGVPLRDDGSPGYDLPQVVRSGVRARSLRSARNPSSKKPSSEGNRGKVCENSK